MITCLGDMFFPEVGVAMVRLLRGLGYYTRERAGLVYLWPDREAAACRSASRTPAPAMALPGRISRRAIGWIRTHFLHTSNEVNWRFGRKWRDIEEQARTATGRPGWLLEVYDQLGLVDKYIEKLRSARKWRDRSAADDKDVLRFLVPVPRRPSSANSAPSGDFPALLPLRAGFSQGP